MNFPDLLEKFAAAVVAGDGAAFAALFVEDGVYHDIFFGAFEGREAIAAMLAKFHEGGRDFKWDFTDSVSDGAVGYAKWLFSYTATHERAAGTRVVFDGVGIFRLRDGLIERYDDVCNGAVPLAQMNTPPALMTKMIARWQGWIEAAPGYAAHGG